MDEGTDGVSIDAVVVARENRVVGGEPDGWPTVIPRIIVDDPQALAEFVRDVLGGEGELPPDRPAEMRIGTSIVMISSTGQRPPANAVLYVYVPDVDIAYERAIARGATSLEVPTVQPYGDRRAMVRDRWDNTWQIATRSR
ncbi:PhnB protein [Mycobacterium sp. OTB74]|nr:PhnB protein [Mycobacterium sp. OTB74]